MKSKQKTKRPRLAGGRKVSSSSGPRPPSHNRAFSDDGVDLTLIRWMLSFTPAERLQVLQQNANAIVELRNANPAL
jgi:hypothetical protein